MAEYSPYIVSRSDYAGIYRTERARSRHVMYYDDDFFEDRSTTRISYSYCSTSGGDYSTETRCTKDDSSDRVGVFSHSGCKLTPGDHIYVYRTGFVYSHHGIYVGEEECDVIHFSGTSGGGNIRTPFMLSEALYDVSRYLYVESKRAKSNAKVQKTTLHDFCGGSEPRLAAYGCSTLTMTLKRGGTCYVEKSRPADEVIATAKGCLEHPDMWPKYNVETNNCSHFAFFCKTGKSLVFGGVNLSRTLNPVYKIMSDVVHGLTAN